MLSLSGVTPDREYKFLKAGVTPDREYKFLKAGVTPDREYNIKFQEQTYNTTFNYSIHLRHYVLVSLWRTDVIRMNLAGRQLKRLRRYIFIRYHA